MRSREKKGLHVRFADEDSREATNLRGPFWFLNLEKDRLVGIYASKKLELAKLVKKRWISEGKSWSHVGIYRS